MPDGPMVSPIQRQKVKRTRKPSLVSGLNADWTAITILLLTEHLLFQVLCTHSQQSCVCVCVCVSCSVKSSSVTRPTVAHQPPLSVGFSRQEHWSG